MSTVCVPPLALADTTFEKRRWAGTTCPSTIRLPSISSTRAKNTVRPSLVMPGSWERPSDVRGA